MQLGRVLFFTGLAIAAAGLVWMLSSKLGLGRLPGDVVIERKNYSFYFPIVTSVVISIVLSVVLNLFRK